MSIRKKESFGTRRCQFCGVLFANDQSYDDHILICERSSSGKGAISYENFVHRIEKCKNKELLNKRVKDAS